MCDICNGQTLDQQVDRLRGQIDRRGFATNGVEGALPWCYTIGLTAHHHPELVVAGVERPSAELVLAMFGERVVAGEHLRPKTTDRASGEAFKFVAVHPSRLAAGLCAMWTQLDEATPGLGRLSALQVLVPRTWFCSCHAQSQPRLDLSGGTPAGPNRQLRRRAARGRRNPTRR